MSLPVVPGGPSGRSWEPGSLAGLALDLGVLFSFSDDSDALMIVNPATGEAVEYVCSFQTIDCEGLVFTTQFRDSFGEIVVDACD